MDYINSNAKLKTVPDLNGGVNYYEEPHKIRDNQLADVCNMEFEDGILRQRSGYEGLFSEEEYGEILAIKEFNGKYYCAVLNRLYSVDKETKQIRLLKDNMKNIKGGTFIVKNDILYYFSGDEIFKVNSYLSIPDLEEQALVSEKPVVEIETNIYTDGENIYDLSGAEPTSYSLGQTVNCSHICKYRNFIYGMKITNEYKGTTDFIQFSLTKNKEGNYTAEQFSQKIFTMPFNGEATSTVYVPISSNKIRNITAVKGYILINLDNLFSTSGNVSYKGYRPMSVKYNLETDEIETLCEPSSNLGTNGLIATYGDTVIEVINRVKYRDNMFRIYIRNYETGEEKSFNNNVIYELTNTSSSNRPLEAPSTLTVVNDDVILLTAIKNTEYTWKTYLLRIMENRLVILDETTDLISDLMKCGSNYYQMPRNFDNYPSCFRAPDKNTIRCYNFSKDNISRGTDKRYDSEIIWNGTSFCKMNNAVYRLATSEFVPVKVEGYIPTVLNARYNATLETYEVLNNEQYNFLTSKAKIQVIEGKSSVLTMDIPVKYSTLDTSVGIITSGSGTITAKDNGNGGTTLTKTLAFEVGETITFSTVVTSKDNPVRNCHLAIPYGGSSYTEGSGTRLFAAGDPKNGNTYYYSDVNNFEYFPELNFDILDNSSAPITGFAKHYQDLIVFKSDSISKLSYQYEESKVVFPVVNVHDSIGCDMPGSIQMVNNDVVFGNALKGLHLLSIKELSDERNVFPISMNLNGRKGLGKYSVFEKQNARSFDFKNKYYLAVGDDIYIWNYELTPFQGYQENISWYVWRDIPVSSFCTAGDCLAFVPRGSFALYAFNGAKDDGGKAIRASFTTKAFDFGDANALKAVWQVWMNITSDRDFPLYFKSVNEKGECLGHTISFHANRHFGNVMTRRMKHKRILYLGFHLENGEQGTAFDVSNIKIEYEIYKSRR